MTGGGAGRVAAPIWSASACLSWQPTQPEGTAVAVVEARAPVDVWADVALLAVLRGNGYPSGSSAAEKDRLQYRARGYEWRVDHLVRRLVSGDSARVVPRLAARGSLIKDVHERAGHLGVKKTLSLLRPHYWWVGMAADVARALKGCEACDRVKVTFSARHPTLQPLPIKGLFYRWGLDFAGPLLKTRRGNQYVLVMVEHFSKTVVLVPTRDKEPATVAEAFNREVLTRYGAPAEVVTDRGGEFGGAFQECLDAALVDHRATSAYHPQANGLSERIVQVVKRALRKWCLGHPTEEWDVYLP
jgi:transposase InsO family protein